MRRFAPLIALLSAAACNVVAPPQQLAGETMGTTYSITVARMPEGMRWQTLQSAVDQELARINRHLSTYDSSSEISRFNATASTVPIEVTPPLAAVVSIAAEVSATTGGAFDITVGPLVRAWGFGETATDTPAAPDPTALGGLRSEVGYEKLDLAPDRRSLRKSDPGVQLDVNGIAPGYAVDRIAERFDALGVHDYLIELGGEVRTSGRSPSGRAWRLAVEAPLSGERRPYAIVEIDGMSASTSGDYRDFRIVDGRRRSHTIDPRTGEPVTHRLASVCVLHASAAYADAYATAMMVLGPAEGMVLAKRLGLAALFIERTPDGRGFTERSTPEFERLRRKLD